jgi:hypothetical protein
MGATENVSRFSLYLFSQVHNHNINKSNRYFKLNVYYNDIDIQCLVTVHALAITPCGQRLPSRPVVGACHHAPWVSACHHAPWVSAYHRTPCGPLARPVVRLPSHAPWSACRHAPWSAYHRTPCGPLAIAPLVVHFIAPPRGPLAIVPPVVGACHHAPWVCTCHRAPHGPLAVARPVVRLPSRPAAIVPCGRQNSSHTQRNTESSVRMSSW